MPRAKPQAFVLPLSLASLVTLGGCSGEGQTDDELGESSSDSSDSSGSESSTSETGSDGSGSDESEADTTSSTDSDTTDSDTTDSDTTDSSDTEESCEDNQFLGQGIADDGWGVGSFCDSVWICVEPDQQAAVEAAAPSFACGTGGMDPWTCPGDLVDCGPVGQVTVDTELYEQLCAALGLPGVDAAHCLVLGP